jgi:PEGA domain
MTAAAGAAPGNAPAVAKTKPPGQEKPTPAVSATPTASKDGLTEAEHHAKHGLHHRAPQTAEATSEAKPQAEGPTAATAGAERSAADAKTGTDKPSARAAGEKAAGEKAAGEKAADDNAGGEAFAAASAPGAPAATTPEPASPTLRVTSSPAGAEVIIDGTSLGYTPFSTKALDPGSPHAITVKKTGYESTDRMISGLDWSRPHGNSPQSLKLNVKLRRAAASPPETPAPPKDNAGPADDSGGPYIKEIKPDKP